MVVVAMVKVSGYLNKFGLGCELSWILDFQDRS